MNPVDLLDSRQHEWVRAEEEAATIGTRLQVEQELGKKIHVQLPKAATQCAVHEAFGPSELDNLISAAEYSEYTFGSDSESQRS